MKTYFLLEKDSEEDFNDRVKVIKDGFMFLAAFFQLFWAIFHRLWYAVAVILLIHIIYAATSHFLFLEDITMLFIDLGIILFVGYSASDWLLDSYKDKGYKIKTIIIAYDEQHAKQRYIDHVNNSEKLNFIKV